VAAPVIQRNRTLPFPNRVAYQRAIEEIYWRHRIWPKANPGPKPPLDKVMSQALEDYWQRPITADQLQAERIASHNRQPGVLREIFAALGNDSFVIDECLARPVLAERLVTELYVHDQRFHGELKRRVEAELRTHPSVRQVKQTSGMCTEMEWIKSDVAETASAPADTKSVEAVKMSGSEWDENVQKLAAIFGNGDPVAAGVSPQKGVPIAQIKTGVLSPRQEDEGHYYAIAVMKKGKRPIEARPQLRG
jgi:hypothetical protein